MLSALILVGGSVLGNSRSEQRDEERHAEREMHNVEALA
jgi:hypothetical protein